MSGQLASTPANRGPVLLELWVLAATWCSLVGWGLALAGALTPTGYVVAGLTGFVFLLIWWRARRQGPAFSWKASLRRWIRRARRPLPGIFLTILFLAGLGGALHPPNNYDALTYRIPQILHWLEAGHWHWIATSNHLVNITPPGLAWLMAPMLALAKTDRGFFLPNIVAFAMLPGAFLLVLRGCRVQTRVAWHWMWLLPAGYCYALQAGGIGSDLLPTAYMLAAVGLALRARSSGRVGELWISALAAGLASGVKVIPLPLLLVWLIAAWPAFGLLRGRGLATTGVAIIAAAISFVPTALLNLRHTGDWSGDPANFYQVRLTSPLYGIAGNAVELTVANAAPPVWPAAGAINRRLAGFLASEQGQKLRQHYPRFSLSWGELASEETSGLGVSLCILAGISLLGAAASGRLFRPGAPDCGFWIGLGAAIAFLAFCTKMGSESAPRLAAPYYPFLLIPFLRLPVNRALARARWWRALAVLAALSILPVLVLTPSRPLWPAHWTLARLAAKKPASALLRRAAFVYEVYAQRADHLDPLKFALPRGARAVGFIPSTNDLEASLWKPFGQRRVIEILSLQKTDPALAALRGSVVVTSRRALEERFQTTPAACAESLGGQIIATAQIPLKAARGPEEFVVIRLP